MAARRKPDQLTFADMRAQRPIAVAQSRGQLPGGAKIDRRERQLKRANHAVEVRQIIGERRLRNAEVAADHDRVEWQYLNGFAGVKFGSHHRR